jgi:DNA excision repair protein ERCC-5
MVISEHVYYCLKSQIYGILRVKVVRCLIFVLYMKSYICIARKKKTYVICYMVLFLQSSRKRKQVTYMEDGLEAYDNDIPMHQNGENNPSQAAAVAAMAGEDRGFNLYHQDTSELNSSRMDTGAGTTEDINEYSQDFELREDNQVDSAPKDYLFSGGGFCMEEGEGDEQEPAGEQSGAEIEPGPSGPCDAMDGVSESGKSASMSTAGECTENASMEARGASSWQQRRKASRGLSAMPTLTKRRRKS